MDSCFEKAKAKSHSVARGCRRPRVQEPVFSNIPSSLWQDLDSLELRVNSDLRIEEIDNGFPLNYKRDLEKWKREKKRR